MSRGVKRNGLFSLQSSSYWPFWGTAMGPSQRGRGDLSINKALMPLAPCLEKSSAESRTNNSSLRKQQEKHSTSPAYNTEGWIWVWFWL